MTIAGLPPGAESYPAVLGEYIHEHSESSLYRASVLSQIFVENGMGPDEIIAFHFEALEQVMKGASHREQARAIADAHQFLLEVMIAYGVRFKEYLELKVRDSIREAELRANVDRQRALEAQQAERQKSEIMAMISHELRTPLTAAKGNIDIAVYSMNRGQVERVVPLLGNAQEALERLSRLTADLVEASRGEPPKLEFAEVDLNAVVDQACRWVHAAAASKNIFLKVEKADGPVPVRANTDAMLSALGNLLSNAVRYTPNGGEIAVRMRNGDGQAAIEVQDNGIGMTPEVQERIFERFYRGPQARSVDGRGLGLGLALALDMVRAHEGRLEVESVPGDGSTFRIVLPLAVAPVAEGLTEERQTHGQSA